MILWIPVIERSGRMTTLTAFMLRMVVVLSCVSIEMGESTDFKNLRRSDGQDPLTPITAVCG